MEKKKRDDTAAEPVLVTAAEKIGHAAGKIASLLGVKAAEPPPTPSKLGVKAAEPPPTPSKRKPKLPKRDKHRLPRRQKKTQQKAASREQAASKR